MTDEATSTDESGEPEITAEDVMQMTADIVASFVSNNTVPADNVPDIIRQIHTEVHRLAVAPLDRPQEKSKPAVPISKSITDDHIICLEDGKKLKMLKRYLRTTYGMTPEEYRRKWGLPADYPMVAPNYAKRRSEYAKQIGLGRGVRRKGA